MYLRYLRGSGKGGDMRIRQLIAMLAIVAIPALAEAQLRGLGPLVKALGKLGKSFSTSPLPKKMSVEATAELLTAEQVLRELPAETVASDRRANR